MPRAQTKEDNAATTSPGGVMRMTVYLQQGEWDALKDEAEKHDTTMANLIRKSVRKYLKLD